MALLLWWPIIGPAPVRSNLSTPQKIVYLLLAVTPSAALAAFITLSGDSLYAYESTPLHWNMLSHVEDQTWGGLIMWLPGNFLFLGVPRRCRPGGTVSAALSRRRRPGGAV